jgi:hypothetical protein
MSRLKELEEAIRLEAESVCDAIKAAAPFLPRFRGGGAHSDWRVCVDCGTEEEMSVKTHRCKACRAKRDRERQTDRQRERRRLKSGLWQLKRVGQLPITQLQPVKRPCEHCGEPFIPQRTTARFCSTKCRVYHHRRK